MSTFWRVVISVIISVAIFKVWFYLLHLIYDINPNWRIHRDFKYDINQD